MLMTMMGMALSVAAVQTTMPQSTATQATATQGIPSATAATAAPARGLSLNRFKKKQRTKLMAADKDADGKVSQAEYTAAHPGAKPRAFKRMDTNSDGFVTATEADAGAAARFAKMDADGNGSLAKTERGGKKKAAASTVAATTPAGE